jgi:hypothetical protein
MNPRKKPREKSARARRRAAARGEERVGELREQLFATQPSSSAERPLGVSSASVIEPHARALPCPRCEGALHVEEHSARTIGDRRLREVRVACRRCGARRSLWYELVQPDPT